MSLLKQACTCTSCKMVACRSLQMHLHAASRRLYIHGWKPGLAGCKWAICKATLTKQLLYSSS